MSWSTQVKIVTVQLYICECVVETNVVECELIAANSRVVPLKLVSTPRLELIAAVMGTRPSSIILNSMPINVSNVIYWCDSKKDLS